MLESRLDERVALVTGASAGAGRDIARALARAGAWVHLCARTKSDLDAAVQTIRAEGGRADALVADLLDPAAVAAIPDRLAQIAGRLDILVNNAGGPTSFGGWPDLVDDDWQRVFEFNVFSPMRLMRGCLPLLRKSQCGRIITIGSTSALEPNRYNPHYAAAKAALHNLSKYLSHELAPENITVNVIAPATLDTRARSRNIERRSNLEGLPVETIRQRTADNERAKIPLGRIGTGDDVGALVAFVASDAAAWMTGSVIVLDGGSSRFAW